MNIKDMPRAEIETRLAQLAVFISENDGMADAAYGCGAILDAKSYAASAQQQREEQEALERRLREMEKTPD